MKLPQVQYVDSHRDRRQTAFGGINRRRGAGDGEIADMLNMSSNEYPLLATRPAREYRGKYTSPQCLYYWDGLCAVYGGKFYYNGVERGTVTAGEKTLCGIGNYVVILQDKKAYNIVTQEWLSMEATWTGEQVLFTNGTLYGGAAECNTIQGNGVDYSEIFNAGDAVTISGCTQYIGNNKTAIIREIDGDRLYFYENTFVLDGEKGLTPYTEGGGITIKRAMPEMDYICENDNRLWGCKGNEIYACALGDIFNWNKFDGVNTDSYAVDVGSNGSFTGCISYSSYPTFFKEKHIYRMYGNYPANYQLMGSASIGLMAGESKSLAFARERLFYLSATGIMQYTGGLPASVNEVFGTERFKDAVAGTDGEKYYVSMEGEDGQRRLYVYDTEYGTWHIEDGIKAKWMCCDAKHLWLMTEEGDVWLIGNSEHIGTDTEPAQEWMMETADYTDREPQDKHQSTVRVRLELERGASVRLYVKYDSGRWMPAGKPIHATKKKSVEIPVITRRCDHYRLRLQGAGTARIYSITRRDELCADLMSYATT